MSELTIILDSFRTVVCNGLYRAAHFWGHLTRLRHERRAPIVKRYLADRCAFQPALTGTTPDFMALLCNAQVTPLPVTSTQGRKEVKRYDQNALP